MPSAPNNVETDQRAHVTLMFSDVCGYTAFSEQADPEEVGVLRRLLQTLATPIVRRHGGVITQCYGDSIVAVFGLPIPNEDDPRRAVEATLEFHEAVRASSAQHSLANFELRMHSGVHTGVVLARIGDTLHGRYDITGDAINTAARIASAAGRDEVLVSHETLSGLEAFFTTEPAVELTLKGKHAPVRVHRVTGRSGIRTRFEARVRRGLTPFVGRTAALEQLMRSFRESSLGSGRMTFVTGSAGIGKTRLLEEFRERATDAGAIVLTGSCDSYGDTTALEPFLQVMRQLFGIQLNMSAKDASSAAYAKLEGFGIQDQADVFLRLLSLPATDPRPGKALATFRALIRLRDAVCQRGPLVLLLDDWQWADLVSERVLSRMARSIAHRPMCLVVGARESEPLRQKLGIEATVLELPPFNPEESREVVDVLRASDLDVGSSAALHERSGGNPLYLEELCQSLRDNGRAAHALEPDNIPSTLHGLIQARMARLSYRQTQMLQRASVIGIESPKALLIRPGAKKAEDDLAALVDEGLIYPVAERDALRFKHGITREVVYSSVLMSDRKKIHHEIASALARQVAIEETVEQSEALSFHYRGSGDHERAATYAEKAGDKAAASSFVEVARLHYESALASLDHVTLDVQAKQRWLRICAKWSAQCTYAPWRFQLAALARADAYALDIGDNSARAHNNHMRAWFHYVFGDYAESIRYCEDAFALAEQVNDQKLIVQLWNSLGQAHGVSGQYDEALRCLNHGIQQKRARSSDPNTLSTEATAKPARRPPPILYAHSLTTRAMVYAYRGAFAEADDDMGEALSIITGTGHAMEPSVLSHYGIILVRKGNWEAALDVARKCRRLAERLNSNFVFGLASALANYSQWRLNRSDDMLAELRRAVDWLEYREFGLYISFLHGCLAEAFSESGDVATARSYAQRAIQRSDSGDPQGDIAGYRVMAHAAFAERLDPSEVGTWLSRALATAKARESRREEALTRLSMVCLRARTGFDEDMLAAAQARELADQFREMDMPWYAELARREGS